MNESTTRVETTGDGTARAVVAILVVSTVVRLVVAALAPVLEAEAYYWLWSERLAWGYADHPPMVAVLMALGGVVAGNAPIGLRIGAVALGTGGLWVFHRFCRQFVGERTALVCLGFLTIAPVWLPFGVLMTPDSGLLFFWMAALAAFWGAYRSDGWGGWLLTGALTGLAILSKYNGFQLPLVFFVFLALTGRGRGMLRSAKPWVAVAVALAIASPNLVWNAAHGGETFATPLESGVELGKAAVNLLTWAILPLALLMPLVGIAWIRRSVAGARSGRWRTDERFLFLMVASWVPTLAFGVVSFATQIHAQWMATAMLAAVPLAFEGWERADVRPGRRFLRAGLAVTALFPLAVALLPVAAFGLAHRFVLVEKGQEPDFWTSTATRLAGDDALAARLDALIEERGTDGWFLTTANYHLASKLEWMVDGRVPALPVRQKYQARYSTLVDAAAFVGRDALWVDQASTPAVRNRLRNAFESYERIDVLRVELGGAPRRRWVLFWAKGFRGPVD